MALFLLLWIARPAIVSLPLTAAAQSEAYHRPIARAIRAFEVANAGLNGVVQESLRREARP